jgi:isocitrate/isopropylmalate dehydrogenase
MEKKIAVLNGDGIGPEVTAQSIKVLNAIAQEYGHIFHYKEALVGAVAIDKTGTALPSETIDICLDSDAVLFGAVGDPKYDNDPTAKVRPEQGLLVSARPWVCLQTYVLLLLTQVYSIYLRSKHRISKVLIWLFFVN